MLSSEFDKNAKHVDGLLGLGSRSGFCSSCSCVYFSSSFFVSSTQNFPPFFPQKNHVNMDMELSVEERNLLSVVLLILL